VDGLSEVLLAMAKKDDPRKDTKLLEERILFVPLRVIWWIAFALQRN